MMPRLDRLFGGAVVATLLLTLPPMAQAQQGPVPAEAVRAGIARMAPHRAAYRLDLSQGRDSGITQVDGAMVFEVQDACEGWATRQRMTMTMTDRDGQRIETASDYATYEAKDASRLRFSLVQSTQGAVSQRVSGEAELNPDGSGIVRYAEPAGQEERLPPGTLLPMRHTVLALETARIGQRILLAPLFDGTSDDGAQDTTTVISAWQSEPAGGNFPMLQGQASARLRVAFFERGAPTGGAAAPEYEVGLRYFENGVADELVMDFGEFSVAGRMLELLPLPGGC